MKTETLLVILVAALVASILAAPLTEAFLEAGASWNNSPWAHGTKSPSLADRDGNAGYGSFVTSYRGGFIPNGYTAMPVNHNNFGNM